MKEKVTDELKMVFLQSKEWLRLEVEYAKLTAAEKFTVMMSTFIMGAVCLLLGFVVLILWGFSLAELFKLMMVPALAYLSAGGCLLLILLVVYLLRKPLLLNPLARFITKLIFEHSISKKESSN